MCTAILSIEPGAPALLAGVRDEMSDRAWEPPARHWAAYPGLIGGRDLLAGGTWLAVSPGARRVACVLNGRGRAAPPAARRSRGELPLLAAAGGSLDRATVGGFDPFHLLIAEPGGAQVWTWDGDSLTVRELRSGLHVIVNGGLATGPPGDGTPPPGHPAHRHGRTAHADGRTAHPDGRGTPPDGPERARLAHFLPLLNSAPRPAPRPAFPVGDAWGAWLPLADGAGIAPRDERALIVRRELGDGRVWGTTSVSLVALSAAGCRYDFNSTPGDPRGWFPVATGAGARQR